MKKLFCGLAVVLGFILLQPPVQTGQINMVAAGCKGDNSTDNTAAIRAAISTAANGSSFYFPQGTYLVSGTIDFSRLSSWSMTGDSMSASANFGSTLIGNVPGSLIQSGASTLSISGMNLVNSSTLPNSWAMSTSTNTINAKFDWVRFAGYNGIFLNQPYSDSLRSCKFNAGQPNKGIGLQVDLSTAVGLDGCDITGWGEGIRACGAGVSVRASRFEVNHIGMNLGVRPDGSNWQFSRSSLAGLSMEANDIFINAVNVGNGVTFDGIGARGSVNAPSGLSQTGFLISFASSCSFNGCQVDGAYSNTAWQVGTQAGGSPFQNVTFSGCRGVNGQAPGTTWKVLVPGCKWIGCDWRNDARQDRAVPIGATSYVVTLPGPEANYTVQTTPNWNTAVWVTGKTGSQFTTNFSVPAPAGATLDWLIR